MIRRFASVVVRSMAVSSTVSVALTLCVLVSFPRAAWAATLADVTFEDTLDVEGRKFVLNGLGLRKFAIFKVYVGALYLEKKSSSASDILAASGAHRVLKLRFLRDVGAKDMQKAWSEGFAKNCSGEACQTMKADVDTLNAAMVDCKEGQTLQFHLTPEGVLVSHEGMRKVEVKKAGFSDQVLAIFIGKNPPNEGLREGLLGK